MIFIQNSGVIIIVVLLNYLLKKFIRWLTGSNTPTSSGGSKDTVSPWITCLISVGVKTPTETASFIKDSFEKFDLDRE